eukprot:9124925-Ditylum_brightwellii.AAC.1
MIEGFAQGCPLSAIFSALVFGKLLKEIATRHDDIVELRTHHLDNGTMAILAYINDASVVLRHANALWLFETIEELGVEFRCKMNIEKNKIPTTTTGASILPYINNTETRDNLAAAINRYTTGETTDGIT